MHLSQTHWIHDALIYHIYPLGLCNAPKRNDFSSAPSPRLDKIYEWIDHIVSLNMNTVYLGPLFESSAHGYDTADYFLVDRRLGDNQTLKNLIHTMKSKGLRVILDGVFNHVGRDFWAFRDVQMNGNQSAYTDWFHQLNFDQKSPYGDPFSYEGWDGHYDLVKLNLDNLSVRQHLFDAITMWVQEFDIDGLRLDAADVLHPNFMRELAHHTQQLKSDFWLMGEVVHGDYRQWANQDMLHSTTNYECYKGLYSSHVDKNYFEIAYSLNRQFGQDGIYKDLRLYSFVDNHDVNRIASQLTQIEHLYPAHILLFTMPGVPSIYYGSEWGIAGARTPYHDHDLRPALDLSIAHTLPHHNLEKIISQLAYSRTQLQALQQGDYRQLHVNHEQFAFMRSTSEQCVIVAVNSASQHQTIHLTGIPHHTHWVDMLNQTEFVCQDGTLNIPLHPNWGAILTLKQA